VTLSTKHENARIDTMRVLFALTALLMAPGASSVAGMADCACDAAQTATLARHECSLCAVAEQHASGPDYFAIRDASPAKPNRWLALTRFHAKQPEELAGIEAGRRADYWKFAIEKARELWGERWGLAVNSVERRTQCHMHIHIGRLVEGVEDRNFVVVKSPDQIPLPRPRDGIWVHPAPGGFHVHWGNQAPELLLEP
jgi:hypothetical protein